jgi:hypothetical protein
VSGQQHDEAIDAHAPAAGGWQGVLQRLHVLGLRLLRFLRLEDASKVRIGSNHSQTKQKNNNNTHTAANAQTEYENVTKKF